MSLTVIWSFITGVTAAVPIVNVRPGLVQAPVFKRMGVLFSVFKWPFSKWALLTTTVASYLARLIPYCDTLIVG